MSDTHDVQLDSVYSLAFTGQSLFAARATGLYRSHDNGKMWQKVPILLDEQAAFVATVVTAIGNTLFVGANGAILRSEDGGDNWQIIGLASPPPLVVAIAVSPNYQQDGIVIAATAEDGVFISTDNGQHWVAWNFGLIDYDVFALVLSPNFGVDNTLFAGTASGIFRSHNGGRSWQAVDFPMDAAPVLSLGISPNDTTDGLLLAGTEQQGLFASNDSGRSWQQIHTSTQAIHALHFTPEPKRKIYMLMEDKLLFSIDRGTTWQAYPAAIEPDKMAMTLFVHPALSDTVLVGCADGDILQLTLT